MHNKIRELRKQQGISQNALADKTGFTAGYICLLENNLRENPSCKAMIKIATALNKKVDEVFDMGRDI